MDFLMKNIWHGLSDDRVMPNDFMAVIEIPKGMFKSCSSLEYVHLPDEIIKIDEENKVCVGFV